MTLTEINRKCSDAYQEALQQARRDCGKGAYRSRGRWLKAVDFDGNVIRGECDTWEWKGTKQSLSEAEIEFFGGNVQGVYIEGGIDYAESLRAMNDFDYTPWVEEWRVTLFYREAA